AEAERGEVMAEEVVQIARDARPFCEPARLGEKSLRRLQLGVEERELAALARLALRDPARVEGERGEAAVRGCLDRDAERVRARGPSASGSGARPPRATPRARRSGASGPLRRKPFPEV